MTTILLIEDDVNVAIELRSMIEYFGKGFKVISIISSISEAKQWLLENKTPHLIVCDVELHDGLGFKIFQDFTISCPVIFCTTHDDYTLKAFENNGIDYLLKPVDQKALFRSLDKYCRFRSTFQESTIIDHKRPAALNSHLHGFRSSILTYQKDQIIPVDLSKVDFIYYNNYQVNVHLEALSYETRDSLNNILETLNPKDFFRANRQFIINRRSVTNIQHYFGRKLLIGLSVSTPEPVIISKANSPEFLRWVEGFQLEEVTVF